MNIEEKVKAKSTKPKKPTKAKEPARKSLAGKIARKTFSTMFPGLSSFVNSLKEDRKKKKQREPMNKPSDTNSPTRGANQDQSGYNTKSDTADYTISDEYNEGVNPAMSSSTGKQTTQNSPKGTIAKNAPASARALQTAASARVQNKELNARKQKDTQHANMQREIEKRQQASKKNLEKNMGSMTKEEIEHINSVFAKNLEEGYLNLDEKKWIAGAIKHPGALSKAAKAAGETNAEYEQKHKHDSGVTGKRARLALTLKKMHKEEVEQVDEAKKKLGRPSTEDEHPIAQARKVISMRGQHKFTHKSGEKHYMDPKVAHQILHKHDNLKTSAEKDEFAQRVHHSKKSMEDALAGKPVEKKPRVSLAGKITGTQK